MVCLYEQLIIQKIVLKIPAILPHSYISLKTSLSSGRGTFSKYAFIISSWLEIDF
jgi:hypothetical protein